MTNRSPSSAGHVEDMRGTVKVKHGSSLRRLFAFAGPAYLVSVGYMDPGNWATDIEGGSRFGYTLLWVLLMSNVMAILLQTLSARLGIVTGRDLAQSCRVAYPRPISMGLWGLAEIAIAATDLAEVLGTIIGLNLLFGLPLLWGCAVTVFDTFLLLAIQRLGVRKMEAFILSLVGIIGACFLIEMILAKPDLGGIVGGFVPSLPPGALYVAIGIIGATVMPHNLYLHSGLVQSRAIGNSSEEKREACRFNFIDSAIALNGALFINAAILILAASTFHSSGRVVTEIQDAHNLLAPLLGTGIASIAFAVALLAAGQSSTLTGTLAGQIVMEGFLNIRLRPWLRRLITRSLAVIPAAITIMVMGESGTYKLLILSQVILSLQLPFAVIPLLHFTSDTKIMGNFANRLWVKILGWIVVATIVALNLRLVADAVGEMLNDAGLTTWLLVVPALAFVGGLFLTVLVWPLIARRRERNTAAMVPATVGAREAFRHIGVALEHAEGDEEILATAMMLARQNKAQLTLLHVTETPGTMVFGGESASIHRSEDEEYLERVAASIRVDDLVVNAMTRVGRPVEQIIGAAAEANFDLLILGSHGHRGLQDVVHGSTVTGVRHGVTIPVLVVRTQFRGRERANRLS